MIKLVNEALKTEQRFVEYIYPRYYKDTIDLVDLREGIELIEKKYSKYWDTIVVADINMESSDSVLIFLDCYRSPDKKF